MTFCKLTAQTRIIVLLRYISSTGEELLKHYFMFLLIGSILWYCFVDQLLKSIDLLAIFDFLIFFTLSILERYILFIP
jgi:hypothetical protein